MMLVVGMFYRDNTVLDLAILVLGKVLQLYLPMLGFSQSDVGF